MDYQAKFKDADPETKRAIIKMLAKMVAEGKLLYTTLDGEPAVQLIREEKHG